MRTGSQDKQAKIFLEEFDRLAGIDKKAQTEDVDLSELRIAIRHVFEAHPSRRNLIRRDLSEIAIAAAESTKFGAMTESYEGVQTIAKIVGELVTEMVGEAMKEFSKLRRRS